MKRVLLFLLIAFVLIFAGCGDAKTDVSEAVPDDPETVEPVPEEPEAEEPEVEEPQSENPYVELPYWVNPTDSSHINIWDEPKEGAVSLGTIPKGENITIYQVEKNWGYTVYGSAGGWVNLKYCAEGEAPDEYSYNDSVNPTVWYADSPTAKSYHFDRDCYFLNQTTHEIKSCSLDYAIHHGHADPCDNCALSFD